MNVKISQKHDKVYYIRKNCTLKSIYDDENECINYTLSPYVSLVNTSIDQITPYWSTLINYPHQHIDLLIKDGFKPIDRFRFQPIRC